MAKNVRVKVFKSYNSQSGMNVDVFISERNVSNYEGNIHITLTDSMQFIELEGGASSGCPDLYGNVTYKGNKINFAACNPALSATWFSLQGRDGIEHKHNFDNENDTWKTLIDGVDLFVKRLPDGDGCKLFELYVMG